MQIGAEESAAQFPAQLWVGPGREQWGLIVHMCFGFESFLTRFHSDQGKLLYFMSSCRLKSRALAEEVPCTRLPRATRGRNVSTFLSPLLHGMTALSQEPLCCMLSAESELCKLKGLKVGGQHLKRQDRLRIGHWHSLRIGLPWQVQAAQWASWLEVSDG